MIVYVPGVFDIIHHGHINYLRQARKFGDVLIVGLLTDEAVKEYKYRKPIMTYDERYKVLLGIRYVSYILPQFHADPTSALDRIWVNHPRMFPDILVRADDIPSPVPGQEYMESKKKKVEIVLYTKGISSREIKNRIVDSWGVK